MSQEDWPEKRQTSSATDRLPPHSTVAERAVLSCILQSPAESMALCVSRMERSAEAFYEVRHADLYTVFVEMYDADQAIDIVTVTTWLQFQGLSDKVGGVSYLTDLFDAAPSPGNLSLYLQTLMDHRMARSLIRISTQTSEAALSGRGDIKALTDAHAQQALDLAQSNISDEETAIQPLVLEVLDRIETWARSPGAVTGMRTGFHDLDRMTCGLQPGEMFVIAARPSLGKTSIAMNIAAHVALRDRQPVGVFSLEMTRQALTLRLIFSEARVSSRVAQAGRLTPFDYPRITNAAAAIANAPIHINDRAGLSILGLRTRARQMKRAHGINLIVIDYLTLLHSQRSRNMSREEEISEISQGCKGIAKELNVPVIVLSQLNRSLEYEKTRKPRLSDLRGSGSIEQDADVVAFLHKPEMDDTSSPATEEPQVNLFIAKQRNGPVGDVRLIWHEQFCRFDSLSRISDDDVPVDPEPSQGTLMHE